MSTSGLVLLAAVAVVAGVALLPRREVQHPVVTALRVLIPSWRFFDAVGASPELLARSGATPDALGRWQPVIPPTHRRWRHLLWNPEGNFTLACHTLVERLAMDVADVGAHASLPDTVSYRLVLHLVTSMRGVTASPHVATYVQFKLAERDTTGAASGPDILVSEVHRL